MTRTQRTTRNAASRTGLTLYEVVLSIGIFLMAMAALSELISVGSRAAVKAELETQAALYAESKMAEIVSGAVPMTATGNQPLFPDDPSWQWRLTEGEPPAEGLKDLTVTVMHMGNNGEPDATYSLRRFVRDPQLYIDAALEKQQHEESESSLGSQNSLSTGSSSR